MFFFAVWSPDPATIGSYITVWRKEWRFVTISKSGLYYIFPWPIVIYLPGRGQRQGLLCWYGCACTLRGKIWNSWMTMIGDNLQWWPMAMLAMMITWQWWQRFFQPKSGELLLVEESRCFFLHHRHSQTALVLPKNPEYIDLKAKMIVTMKIDIFIFDQLINF